MSAAPFTTRATPTATASASTPNPGHANTTTPRAIQPAPTSHRYAGDRSAGEDRVSAPVSRALMPVSRTKTAAEVNGRNVRTAPTTTHATATITTSQAGNRDNRRAGHRDTKRLTAGTVAVCHRPASLHRSQTSGACHDKAATRRSPAEDLSMRMDRRAPHRRRHRHLAVLHSRPGRRDGGEKQGRRATSRQTASCSRPRDPRTQAAARRPDPLDRQDLRGTTVPELCPPSRGRPYRSRIGVWDWARPHVPPASAVSQPRWPW